MAHKLPEFETRGVGGDEGDDENSPASPETLLGPEALAKPLALDVVNMNISRSYKHVSSGLPSALCLPIKAHKNPLYSPQPSSPKL